ncbi:MAG: TauD/TfdA family dioxygenase [Acidobacteriota bacterium]
MKSLRPKKSLGNQLGRLKRKAVDLSPGRLIDIENLESDRGLPRIARPAIEGVNLASWLSKNRALVQRELQQHGGILFRGFKIDSDVDFQTLIQADADEMLDYTYRSTPRTRVSGNVFTSTEYPPDQSIPMHNEMSYTRSWPLKIWFFCMQPSEAGGETPIADSHRVYERIDPAMRDRFAEQGVLYVRNYGDQLDLSWEDVFQTSERTEVEAFCSERGIEVEWREGNRLRTRQRCQGVVEHPQSGKQLWFNQAHLFHVSGLPEAIQEALLSSLGEENLPRNTYYGDGAPIEAEVLQHITECFEQEMVVFPWQKGDVLLLDNMAVAHGRRPFSGTRRVLAGMTGSSDAIGVTSEKTTA